MIEFINNYIFESEYSLILTLITIVLVVISIYNRIKFLCLQKATELVSSIEDRDDLSGEEKFAIVVKWINNDLPKIFRSSLFKSIIEKLVQFAYDNCYNYMKNYIKRKTGYDVSGLIEQFNSEEKDSSDQQKNHKFTE